MLKLIKLEYKKTKLINVFWISMFAMVALMFWCVWSKSGHPKGYTSYQSAFAEISFYTNMVSLIISAILIIKIVHDEFRRKTITVLFTYPHPRAKLFSAKLILISLLAFAISWGSNLIVSSVFLLFSSSIQPDLGNPTNKQLFMMVIRTFLFAITTIGINLISFFFGMLKPSILATLTPPLFISFIFSSFYTLESLKSVLMFTSGCLVTGLFLAYLSIQRVTQLDINEFVRT